MMVMQQQQRAAARTATATTSAQRLPPPLCCFPVVAAVVIAFVLITPSVSAAAAAAAPADVQARWAHLDTTKWSFAQLLDAVPLLQAPPGFEVSLYWPEGLLNSARSLAISGASKPGGGPVITYVSTRLANSTYALVDDDGDGRADAMTVLLSDLDTPQGVAWHDGDLYVSGWDAATGDGCIWRARGVDAYALSRRQYPRAALEAVSCRLPRDRWHGERYMRFGPDGLLYVSVGAPCDVCAERTSPRGIKTATIYTLNATLGDEGWQLYARGVRNSVGFDWHPQQAGVLYFTDNGRDGLGDNKPDDKLLRAASRGRFYGFPYCHTQGRGDPYLRQSGPAGHGVPLPDPKYNQGERTLTCSDRGTYVRPVQALGPHVAALGLRFYRRDPRAPLAWPAAFDNAVLIAQHGSWDRTSKIGYRLAVARVAEPATASAAAAANAARSAAEATAYKEFLTGFVGGARGAPKATQPSWGRPVDVQQLPDGSVLVSDDGAHTVYRIAYTGSGGGAGANGAAAAGLFESGPAPADGRAAASGASARSAFGPSASLPQLLLMLLMVVVGAL